MPWKVVENHPDCPSSKPYAVVNKSSGRKMGCHDSRDSANKQIAALNVNVEHEASRIIEIYRKRMEEYDGDTT